MDTIVRPYADADAGPLAVFCNDLDAAFGGRADNTAEDMRSWMADLHDVTRDSRLVCAPDGSIVACGVASAPRPDGVQCRVFGGVAAGWRGQGIGRDLFEWQMARCEQLHLARAPGVEWTVQAYVASGDATALRLYERYGFAPTRYWFTMTAATGAAPAVPLPGGIVTVPYAPGHRVPVHAAHMEAFAGHFGFEYESVEHWARATVDSADFRADLSRIAFDGEEVAAILLCFSVDDPQRLYVGVVGTRAPWRRRGLASALLAGALTAAADAGFTTAALNVDAANPSGAVGVYERVGFTVESQSVSYTLILPAITAPMIRYP